MALKYEADILFNLMKRDGYNNPSNVLPYECELKEKYVEQVIGAYPKLQDYRSEWLAYNLYHHLPSDFPIQSLTNVTNATFQDVVPYAYGKAILKGSTKYCDIDTGEVLDAFEDGRNLELVSVKLPVLTTTGKNLFDGILEYGSFNWSTGLKIENSNIIRSVNPIKINSSNICLTSATGDIRDIQYVFQYDNSMNFISYVTNVNGKISLDTNAKYIHIRTQSNGGNGYVLRELNDYQFQIEQGSTATPYEPYKSNILSTSEDVTLRGIGDVRDTLDLLTGEVIKNTYKYTLTGNESISLISSSNTNTTFKIEVPNIKLVTRNTIGVLSDNFPSVSFVDNALDTEKIFRWDTSLNQIGLTIKNTKASTVEELRAWFSANETNLVYLCDENTLKTVDLTCIDEQGENVNFLPIEGTMHVSTSSSTLQPLLDMDVPVEPIIQNLNSFANMKEE